MKQRKRYDGSWYRDVGQRVDVRVRTSKSSSVLFCKRIAVDGSKAVGIVKHETQ
jgi:hypothetical protein